MGSTVATVPTEIWLGNPESGEAERVWIADHQKGDEYSFPHVTWSPSRRDQFIFVDQFVMSDPEVWKVNLKDGIEEKLPLDGWKVLAWTDDGILIYQGSILRLVNEDGQTKGEIDLGEVIIVSDGMIR